MLVGADLIVNIEEDNLLKQDKAVNALKKYIVADPGKKLFSNLYEMK